MTWETKAVCTGSNNNLSASLLTTHINDLLAKEAVDGWEYHDIRLTIDANGRTDDAIVILKREASFHQA